MKQEKKRWIWTLVAAGWFVIILIALFMPPPKVDEEISVFEGIDKLIHFALFGIWSIALSLASIERSARIDHLKILFVILFVAIATEFIQTLIADRSGEILDAVADVSGGVVVLLAVKLWKRMKPLE